MRAWRTIIVTMIDNPAGRAKPSSIIWIGLFLSLFVMLIVRQAVSYFWPTLSFTAAIWKESLIWVSAIALLLLVCRGEKLPLTSIGIGTAPWWKSILWGLVLTVICAAVGLGLAVLTKYGQSP